MSCLLPARVRELGLVAALLLGGAPLPAQTDVPGARKLLEQHRAEEARTALEKIVAAEPRNAGAHHALGLAWLARGDDAALELAAKSFARAVELEPENPIHLGDYGGTLLQLAGRTTSLSNATKGRDAMEKAVALKPDYVDAHEGLFQFYQRAPWPLGSNAKAAAHLEAIRRFDADRATVLNAQTKTREKDYAGAFQLCAAVLARDPRHYYALYHYGRTASLSGQNLERGLACLQTALEIEPPSHTAPTHSHVWFRIGSIEEQRQRSAEARAAYASAVKLDPANKPAAEALAKLK
jgi:tetratricopeptide (TPR) repeat protein